MTDRTEEERCGICHYSSPHNQGDDNRFYCRRYPPLVDTWPVVNGNLWCGEYKPREASECPSGARTK